MTTPFYTEMQSVSKRLLETYGSNSTLIRFDPETNSVITVSTQKTVAGPIKEIDQGNSLISGASSILYMYDVQVKPDVTLYVDFNGTRYKIIYVQDYTPADANVLYAVFVAQS